MKEEDIIQELERYKVNFQKYLSRYHRSERGIYINKADDPIYRQEVREIIDFLNDCLGKNVYSNEILNNFNWGISGYLGSPSYKSMENIIGIIGAAITRLRRNPDLLNQRKAQEKLRRRENVFIIHGKDEAKWRELKEIVRDEFRLNPIVLEDQPDAGCKTVIEKFEHYAEECSFAIAGFTPDDEVND